MGRHLKNTLEQITGESLVTFSGGTGKVETASGRSFFLKSGAVSKTYLCEANGLKELAKPGVIRTARVISAGSNYILTEYIENGVPSSRFYEDFGRKFARMHRYKGDQYGFYEDNYIGLNPQLNIPSEKEKNNWAAFFFNKRLLYQYKLAGQNGYITSRLRSGFCRLESGIEAALKDSTEPPALLHGDLWAGNYLCDKKGNAVLIDPAVYYGHREADLAMTKIFGGFPPAFYAAYMEEYRLADGWEYRESMYKLYHILNHLNLFGRSYLAEAEYLLSRI